MPAFRLAGAAQPTCHPQPSLVLRVPPQAGWRLIVLVAVLAGTSGCSSFRDYFANGFKVGPDYRRPAAPVADGWIDAADPAVLSEPPNDAAWWRTFNDPVLDTLVQTASEDNLTLRVAGLRVLEARAQRAMAAGELFPQNQTAFGSYQRTGRSENLTFVPPIRFFDEWTAGVGLAWELDFWGQFRRAIESADASLEATVESYDDVLVLLLAEVAQNYVALRTAEQRLVYAAHNVVIQRESLDLAKKRFTEGAADKLDMTQTQSNLSQTLATIPPLEAARRRAANQLCILLGRPPGVLDQMLDNPDVVEALQEMQDVLALPEMQAIRAMPSKSRDKIIPCVPAQVAVGIPAELLRRRPDVRHAERLVAAQSALIGVAAAELYPHFSIAGSIYVDATNFRDLFTGSSVAGNMGPSFRWNIFNYGRLVNHIRVQDARFQQLAVQYQETVLRANAEAENALIGFLKAQQQVAQLHDSADAAGQSVDLVNLQFGLGKIDFNRVFTVQALLTQKQDQLAAAQGLAAEQLIQLYKALGGGWQIRLASAG